MNTTPIRIQRSRKRGSRLPEGTVYVGRPTLWGNPFQDRAGGHARSVILHREWLAGHLGVMLLEGMGFSPAEIDALARLRARVLINLHRLAGHNLACWCHADTLLRLAPEYAEIEALAA